MDILNNIIIGINELYVCKYLLDLDLTLMNNWRDNYYLESDYDSKMKLSIIFSFAYIGAQYGSNILCIFYCVSFVSICETEILCVFDFVSFVYCNIW